jgi:hypothetical protein
MTSSSAKGDFGGVQSGTQSAERDGRAYQSVTEPVVVNLTVLGMS